jgi:hypothetical protein
MTDRLRTASEIAREGIGIADSITINVDFDGTCTTHAFPLVGEDIGAVPVLRDLVKAGHRLILFTMRSDNPGEPEKRQYLSHAVKWFEDHNLPLYGVNTNPTQSTWTSSPKSLATKMIDDSSICCPLRFNPELSHRPFVDWVRIREMFVEHGLLAAEPCL